jgi:hypothetical protein
MELSVAAMARLRTFIDSEAEKGIAYTFCCRIFREAFNTWNGGSNEKSGFIQAMNKLGILTKTAAYGPDKKATGVYVGIRLKEPVEVPQQEPQVEEQAESHMSFILRGQKFGEFAGAKIRKTNDSPQGSAFWT